MRSCGIFFRDTVGEQKNDLLQFPIKKNTITIVRNVEVDTFKKESCIGPFHKDADEPASFAQRNTPRKYRHSER